MHAIDRDFMRRLTDRILDEAKVCVGQIADGSARDFADYRERCGYVKALDDVRSWCREIAETDEAPQKRAA